MRASALVTLLLLSACSAPEEAPAPRPLARIGPVLERVASYIELNGSWPDRLEALASPDSLAPGLPLQSYVLRPEQGAALRARGLLRLARAGTLVVPSGSVAVLTAAACEAWQLGEGPVLALGLHEGCSLVGGTRPAHLPRAPRGEGAYPFFLFLVDLQGPEAVWLGVLSPDGVQLARAGGGG